MRFYSRYILPELIQWACSNGSSDDKRAMVVALAWGRVLEKGTERWQNLVNPLWKRVSGGCNLNRDIPGLLRQHGFNTDDTSTRYMPGWRLTSYSYWGSALKL
ncbi:MAG: hypothetical protein P1P86_15245 [Bacteroidales bacterium]|nr:hypothetical protein [Bacteroidales bacterium]